MRLIIIDNVSVQDIADILGTRGTEKTEEPKECTQIKVGERVRVGNEPKMDWTSLLGKTIQIDDPKRGYIKGCVTKMDFMKELVTLEDYNTPFEFKHITGIIS